MPLAAIRLVSILAAIGAAFPAAAADDKKPVSKDYTVGKPTQKVTPKEMKETVRPDGKTSIVTGQTRDAKGKITGPHSHSIVNQGKVESSRTAGNRQVGVSVPQQQKAMPSENPRDKGVGAPLGVGGGGGGGTLSQKKEK